MSCELARRSADGLVDDIVVADVGDAFSHASDHVYPIHSVVF